MADINGFLKSVERKAFVTARLATQDEEEAFDIVQDAMMKMVQKHEGLDPPDWPAYFYRILYNKINDWYRRQTVRNRWRVFFQSNNNEEDYQPEDRVRQRTFREPEELASDDDQNEALVASIGHLSLRQQQALLLRLWEGYSVQQSAEIMGCSEGSVKTHFSRAIAKLKVELDTGDGGI